VLIFTEVITTNTDTMTTTKIRKGEYTVNFKGNTYLIMKNWHEDNKSWYVYENGEFLFDNKSKARALRTLSAVWSMYLMDK
jgi:hypothetical protein